MTDETMTEETLTEEPRKRRSLFLTVGGAVVILAVLAALGWWAHALASNYRVTSAESDETQPGTITVQLDQGQLAYACPPGVVDPASPSLQMDDVDLLAAAESEVYELTDGGFGVRVDTSAVGESASTVPLAFAGSESGDRTSFLPSSCMLPATELVLPAGSTVTGEDTVLILSNPSATPVSVRVYVLSPLGSLDGLDAGQDVLVPAESTVSVLPAIWASGEARLSLLLQADGLGIAAWLQSSGLDGEVPQGLGRLQAQVPSTEVLFLGMDAQPDGVLRIANPSTSSTDVTVSVLSQGTTVPLSGADTVGVEGRSVFDVELGSLSDDAAALVVQSETPVAAAITESSAGEPFAEDPSTNVGVRTLIGSATPLERVVLPSLKEMEEASAALGTELEGVQLVLANAGEQSDTVHIGERSVWVEAGSVLLADLSSGSQNEGESLELWTENSASLFAVMVFEGQTNAGLTRSVVALPQDGASRAQQQILLRPYR